jgi:transposase
MNSPSIIVAGVDVSKAYLDVDLAPQPHASRFTYDAEGLGRLIDWLQQHEVQLVVLEATGALERRLARALATAALPFHIANPRQVRDFARAMNQLNKTDKADAHVIAQFGHKLQPRPSVLPSETRQKLIAAVTRHEQLKQMRVAENNRLDRADDPTMQLLIEQMIEKVDQQLEGVEQVMDQLVASDESMQRDVNTIASTPGLGKLTASRLVAMLPELGQCNRQQIARLIGVAPINRDSGTMRGKRTTGGGRKIIRTFLYMPTLVAVRYNPVIRETYQRLVKKGKPKMVALIAAMRKLIIMVNIMIREQKTWSQIVNPA